MARADAAQASAHAGALRKLGCTAQQPPVSRISHLEIWVRRAVPAMVVLFAGALVAISIAITRDAYDRAITDAFDDLELAAGAISSNLNEAFREQPAADLAAALAQAVPSRALARKQQVSSPMLPAISSAPRPPSLAPTAPSTTIWGQRSP